MAVVQVDAVDAETAQRLLDRLFAVSGRGVDFEVDAPVGRDAVAAHAEFGAEEDVAAFGWVGGEPFADDVFGVAVFVGCTCAWCEWGGGLQW